MTKISVGATIGDAYRFAVTHLGGIIGLIWVPMVIATVVGFFCAQRYYAGLASALAADNLATLGPSLMMMLGYAILALLLNAVIYVAVVDLAAGTRSGGVAAHFAFGAREWRMFRAFLAFAALLIGFVTLLWMLAGVVFSFIAHGGALPQPAGSLTLMGLFYFALVAAAPRFFLLLPAIAAGEEGPVLRRAWALSAGNFWRLLAILAAVFVPVLLALAAAEFVLGQMAGPIAGGSGQAQLIAGIARARRMMPMLSGLAFLVSPLLIGLVAGASVSAWRVLKAAKPQIEA
jgi:hypothetical protein